MCSSIPNRHNQQRSANEQQVPPCVEAVLQLDCPSHVVIAAYQQLQSQGYRDVSETGNDAESGPARVGDNFISATLLLMTVDALMKSDFAACVQDERMTQNNSAAAAAAATPVHAAFFSSSAGVEGVVSGSDVLQGPDGQTTESPSRFGPRSSQNVQQKAGDRACGKSKASSASEATPTQAAAGASNAASSTQRGSSPDALKSTATIATRPAEAETVLTTRTAEAEAVSTTRPADVETVSPPTPSTNPTPNTRAASVVTMPKPQTGTALMQGSGTSTEESQARERTRRQLDRLRALRSENRRLKERKLCRQCRQRAVDLTLLPCGHFCFCQQCGSSFHACPLCRKTILADVKTFVS